MIRWLFLGAALIIGLDLALLVVVGAFSGVLPTLAVLALTAVIGFYLAKREGIRVFHAYQTAMAEGRLPDEGILSALLVLAGGVALVVPGFLSDFIGLFLLFAPTRRFVAGRIRRIIEEKLKGVQVVSMNAVSGVAEHMNDGDDLRAQVFDARSENMWSDRPQSSVIDTEGVEVQSSLLLSQGDRHEP